MTLSDRLEAYSRLLTLYRLSRDELLPRLLAALVCSWRGRRWEDFNEQGGPMRWLYVERWGRLPPVEWHCSRCCKSKEG